MRSVSPSFSTDMVLVELYLVMQPVREKVAGPTFPETSNIFVCLKEARTIPGQHFTIMKICGIYTKTFHYGTFLIHLPFDDKIVYGYLKSIYNTIIHT